jgi:hypothetical protein
MAKETVEKRLERLEARPKPLTDSQLIDLLVRTIDGWADTDIRKRLEALERQSESRSAVIWSVLNVHEQRLDDIDLVSESGSVLNDVGERIRQETAAHTKEMTERMERADRQIAIGLRNMDGLINECRLFEVPEETVLDGNDRPIPKMVWEERNRCWNTRLCLDRNGTPLCEGDEVIHISSRALGVVDPGRTVHPGTVWLEFGQKAVPVSDCILYRRK